MESTTTVKVKVEPELSPEFEALLGIATADTLEKVDAGAQLVYALYHVPADTIRQVLDLMPQSFTRALARAHAAYGVDRRRSPERVQPLGSTESTDPVRYVEH